MRSVRIPLKKTALIGYNAINISVTDKRFSFKKHGILINIYIDEILRSSTPASIYMEATQLKLNSINIYHHKLLLRARVPDFEEIYIEMCNVPKTKEIRIQPTIPVSLPFFIY